MEETKTGILMVVKWLLLLILEVYLLLPYVVYRRNTAVMSPQAETEAQRQNDGSPFGPIASEGHYSEPSSNITGK